MSRAKDGERPLIDQAVAGNSPVYGPGWEFPLVVAQGVAGKPGLFLPGRTVYFCPFQPGVSRMTLYGYARVSVREPEDKNLDLQVERLVRAGCSLGNIRAEEASGARNDRGGLLEVLDLVVESDTLVVTHIDRLSRGLTHGHRQAPAHDGARLQRVVAELDQGALGRGAGEGAGRGAVRFKYQLLHRQSTFEEAGLPSGLVKPSAGVGDSLNSPRAVLIMGSTLVPGHLPPSGLLAFGVPGRHPGRLPPA